MKTILCVINIANQRTRVSHEQHQHLGFNIKRDCSNRGRKVLRELDIATSKTSISQV